jgi:excisionase family DNA binding protein
MESRKHASNDSEDRGVEDKLDKLADNIRKLPPRRIAQLEKILQSFEKKVLSIKEAADILDVSADTIRRAIKNGSIKAFQINKAGNWKIPIEEIERFMKG